MSTNKTKVLIVDDHSDVRTPIRLGLEISGFEVSEASDGKSAIEKILQDAPDVVIIDQGLPDITGIEVGRKIRALDSGKTTTIALLTGSDGAEIRKAAVDSGFNEFFLKPISIRELGDWIKNAMSA